MFHFWEDGKKLHCDSIIKQPKARNFFPLFMEQCKGRNSNETYGVVYLMLDQENMYCRSGHGSWPVEC